jgi:hypothetical protein
MLSIMIGDVCRSYPLLTVDCGGYNWGYSPILSS